MLVIPNALEVLFRYPEVANLKFPGAIKHCYFKFRLFPWAPSSESQNHVVVVCPIPVLSERYIRQVEQCASQIEVFLVLHVFGSITHKEDLNTDIYVCAYEHMKHYGTKTMILNLKSLYPITQLGYVVVDEDHNLVPRSIILGCQRPLEMQIGLPPTRWSYSQELLVSTDTVPTWPTRFASYSYY